MRIFGVLLFLISFGASGQQLSMMSSQAIKADVFVGYDKFNYLYFIENNTLHKSNLVESVQYQNIRLGKISSVDLNNPLKVGVFYRDFNTVVLLDNQLNEIGTIDFNVLKDPIVVTALGNASQNRLWFFDSLTQQIGLYETETHTYKFLTQPLLGLPRYWETDLNHFQWVDQNANRYSVDVYGKIADLGKVPDFEVVRFVSDQEIIYSKDNVISTYTTSGAVRKLIETDPKSFQSFWYKDQILAIFTTHIITNYKIITP